ncbi:MAG: DHHA1 domain-containing protein, partial [Planctomycetota bacterium]
PDPVRVVSIGAAVQDLLDDPDKGDWAGLSVEFCGGTHLAKTGEAAAFALVQETGVAKGIRRVEALTGVAAQAALATAQGLDVRITEIEGLADGEVASAMGEVSAAIDGMTMSLSDKARLRGRLAGLQDRAKAASKAAAKQAAERAVAEARQLAESAAADLRPVIVGRIEAGEDRGALQAAIKVIAEKNTGSAVLLGSASHDKVALIAQVPDALVKRGLKAGDWIRTTAEVCGGKGGGKPQQAQGGGTEPEKLREALKRAETFAWGAIG